MKSQNDEEHPTAARFHTTRWSLVLSAGDLTAPEAEESLAALCEMYWYPLYAYLRRKGYSAPESEDLTQGFFCRFLQKNYLQAVKPEKGRFRSYLLGALRHFVSHERDRAQAEKRGGGKAPLRLDFQDAEDRYGLEPSHEITPETLFDRRWGLTLLDRVLRRLQEETEKSGKSELFRSLNTTLLSGKTPHGEYEKLASELDLTEGAVRVILHRLRRRYRALLRDEIAHTVARPQDIDDEIGYLFSILGG